MEAMPACSSAAQSPGSYEMIRSILSPVEPITYAYPMSSAILGRKAETESVMYQCTYDFYVVKAKFERKY